MSRPSVHLSVQASAPPCAASAAGEVVSLRKFVLLKWVALVASRRKGQDPQLKVGEGRVRLAQCPHCPLGEFWALGSSLGSASA